MHTSRTPLYIIAAIMVIIVIVIDAGSKVAMHASGNINNTESKNSILVKTSFYENDSITILSIIRIQSLKTNNGDQGLLAQLYRSYTYYMPYVAGVFLSILCIAILRNISHKNKYKVTVSINSSEEFGGNGNKSREAHMKLLQLLIDVDVKHIHNHINVVYEVFKKLCNLGYKFVVQKEVEYNNLIDRLKLEKCIADIEQGAVNINDIPKLHLSELIKTYTSIQEKLGNNKSNNKSKKDGSTTQVSVNDNSKTKMVIRGSKSMVAVDVELYKRLEKGLSEKDIERLSPQQRILIERLINEGIVYKDRSGRYKTI